MPRHLFYDRLLSTLEVLPYIFLTVLSIFCVNLTKLLNLCESRFIVPFQDRDSWVKWFHFLYLTGFVCGLSEIAHSCLWCRCDTEICHHKSPGRGPNTGLSSPNILLSKCLCGSWTNITLAAQTEPNWFFKHCNVWCKQSSKEQHVDICMSFYWYGKLSHQTPLQNISTYCWLADKRFITSRTWQHFDLHLWD